MATMKAAIATGFGDIDNNIRIRTDWPCPIEQAAVTNDGSGAADVITNSATSSIKDGEMLIRVLACALAPGDCRVLSGKTDYMQLPASGHPYVIGSDTSGIVVAVNRGETKFKPGDYVVARFDEPKPNGGVAEYRVVKTCLSEHCPAAISPIVACGLPASAMAAKKIVQQYMKPSDRVLVIGGSGAVGTSVVQYARLGGAQSIVAISTQEKLCSSLGADVVIDYRTSKWWEREEFHDAENQFDVVFDLVNGENWTQGGCAGKAVKPKGKYIALLSGVATEIEVHGFFDAIRLVAQLVGRVIYSRINPSLPVWIAPEALALKDGDLHGLLDDVKEGRLKPVVDPASPFDFTEQGVRQAMHLQKSAHAHGKVVIKIADM